jgi:hypothetical protein
MNGFRIGRRLAVAMAGMLMSQAAFAADDQPWVVAKASGEVWVAAEGATPASLSAGDGDLKPGQMIRTGRNGRVLLKRGEESMLVGPNSEVGLPTAKADGMATTILQRAGSILLEVEKRNVKHFEVETPNLAAVVKGTQFRVTVTPQGSSVGVLRGQVEVADFRSGQIAQVIQGQSARSVIGGQGGLSLSGSGTFLPIEQGKPRTPTLTRVAVPRGGLTAPRGNGQAVRAVAAIDRAGPVARQTAPSASGPAIDRIAARPAAPRIASALGEVRLNIGRVTHGLARENGPAARNDRQGGRQQASVWSQSGTPGKASANAGASTDGSTAASVTSAGVAAASGSSAAAVAAVTGNGNGNNGNGLGNGGGNGNNGNGNGNSGAVGSGRGDDDGPGRGHHYGRNKH